MSRQGLMFPLLQNFGCITLRTLPAFCWLLQLGRSNGFACTGRALRIPLISQHHAREPLLLNILHSSMEVCKLM